MTDHLSADEIDDAVQYGLAENRIQHLMSCKGCQNSVGWHRMANIGQLWNEEIDWACNSLKSIVLACSDRGNGFVYLVNGSFAALAMLPFQKNRIIQIGKFNET